MSDDQGVMLSRDSARRVAAAVKRVERMDRGDVPRGQRPSVITPGYFAITTSTITAGNQTTKVLGFGTAKLQLISPTSTPTYPYAAITGLADVTVLNGGASIASGRLIQVKTIDGQLVVDVDYCDSSNSGSSGSTVVGPGATQYVNASTTASSASTRYAVDGSGSTVTITLPPLSSWAGGEIPFVNCGASGTFSIAAAGSDVIVDPSTGASASSFASTGPGTTFSMAPVVVASPGVSAWYEAYRSGTGVPSGRQTS